MSSDEDFKQPNSNKISKQKTTKAKLRRNAALMVFGGPLVKREVTTLSSSVSAVVAAHGTLRQGAAERAPAFEEDPAAQREAESAGPSGRLSTALPQISSVRYTIPVAKQNLELRQDKNGGAHSLLDSQSSPSPSPHNLRSSQLKEDPTAAAVSVGHETDPVSPKDLFGEDMYDTDTESDNGSSGDEEDEERMVVVIDDDEDDGLPCEAPWEPGRDHQEAGSSAMPICIEAKSYLSESVVLLTLLSVSNLISLFAVLRTLSRPPRALPCLPPTKNETRWSISVRSCLTCRQKQHQHCSADTTATSPALSSPTSWSPLLLLLMPSFPKLTQKPPLASTDSKRTSGERSGSSRRPPSVVLTPF